MFSVPVLCEAYFAQHPFRVSAETIGQLCNAPEDGGLEQSRPQFEMHRMVACPLRPAYPRSASGSQTVNVAP